MRKILIGLVGLVLAVSFLHGTELRVVLLPPHPLDAAFEKGNSERAVNDALLNNELFQKAVQEALKAKKEQEEFYKKNPKFVGPSPAQAARVKFLEVLSN